MRLIYKPHMSRDHAEIASSRGEIGASQALRSLYAASHTGEDGRARGCSDTGEHDELFDRALEAGFDGLGRGGGDAEARGHALADEAGDHGLGARDDVERRQRVTCAQGHQHQQVERVVCARRCSLVWGAKWQWRA